MRKLNLTNAATNVVRFIEGLCTATGLDLDELARASPPTLCTLTLTLTLTLTSRREHQPSLFLLPYR